MTRHCEDRRVHVGIHVRATATTADVRDLARTAEVLGFESLFLPEHTHVPASFVEQHPQEAEWAGTSANLLDPFLGLAAAASVTMRIRLGTAVCLVPQHDPITLAKRVSTLDVLSGGRFLFGVGAGWIEEEMRHHGVDPGTRFTRLGESLLAMKALWTEEEASFDGEYVRFERVRLGPKPVQQPHPPILVGGNGRRARQLVEELGDEWFPQARADPELETDRPVTMFGVEPEPEVLERYRSAGVQRCVVGLAKTAPGDASRELERLAALFELG
jgi:probable F420-dependent oxidoreductase